MWIGVTSFLDTAQSDWTTALSTLHSAFTQRLKSAINYMYTLNNEARNLLDHFTIYMVNSSEVRNLIWIFPRMRVCHTGHTMKSVATCSSAPPKTQQRCTSWVFEEVLLTRFKGNVSGI